MKVNTMNPDSLFERGFAKYSFNSQKKNWCQIGLIGLILLKELHFLDKRNKLR